MIDPSTQMYTTLLLLSIFLSFLVPTSSVDGDVACYWKNISIVRKRPPSDLSSRYTQGDESAKHYQESVAPMATILSLPRGTIRTGRLTAVMGPSGSGKSSFLNIISERFYNTSMLTSHSDVQHRIDQITGVKFSKRSIAFIHQDDAFFSMLTVNETLKLARNLKIVNEDILNQDSTDLLDLLGSLNLIGVANSRVGDVDERGISGGERKRLSVALQLLGNPKYLIADEPTSGLDSFQATQVVQLLKGIAVDKTIPSVLTIHQPSSSIWSLFDDILLLAPGGKLAFQGNRRDVLPFFEKLGFSCPSMYNPAEFITDLVSIDSSTPERRQESLERIETIVDAFQRHLDTTVTNFAESLLDKTTGYKGDHLIGNQRKKPPPVNSPEFPKWWSEVGKYESPYRSELARKKIFRPRALILRSLRRFSLLFKRAIKQVVRDVSTNVVRVGVSGLIALVVGSVYGSKKDDTSLPISNRVNIIAQAAINVAMLSMIKTLQLLKKEKVVVSRERTQGLYTAPEYLLSKSVAELPMDALVAAVFGQVLHAHSRLKGNRSVFTGVLCLLGCAASSLGLAIGAMFPQGDAALALGPALMIVYVITGAIGPAGLSGDLPYGLDIFRVLSPIRPGCEAILISEISINDGEGQKEIPPPEGMNWLQLAIEAIRIKINPKRTGQSEEKILDSLGIKKTVSIRGSMMTLGKMILGHTLVAIVGLFASSKDL